MIDLPDLGRIARLGKTKGPRVGDVSVFQRALLPEEVKDGRRTPGWRDVIMTLPLSLDS